MARSAPRCHLTSSVRRHSRELRQLVEKKTFFSLFWAGADLIRSRLAQRVL